MSGEAGPGQGRDRFTPAVPEALAKGVEAADRFVCSSEEAKVAVRSDDAFVSRDSLMNRLEQVLHEESWLNLPPVYVQMRQLIGAMADGQELLRPLEVYVAEVRDYVGRQREVFAALRVAGEADLERLRSDMLEGLAAVSTAVDLVEGGAVGSLGVAEGQLVKALGCFLAARDAMGRQAGLRGEAGS